MQPSAHYTTWTMLYDVFRTIGNFTDVIPTISTFFDVSDVFTEFPMFACLYLTYRYIDGLSMHPHTIVIPIQCVTDLLRLVSTLFIFGDN